MIDDPYAAAARLGVALLFVGVALVGAAAGTTLGMAEVADGCEAAPSPLVEQPDCVQTHSQLATYTNCLLLSGGFLLVSGGGMLGWLRWGDHDAGGGGDG